MCSYRITLTPAASTNLEAIGYGAVDVSSDIEDLVEGRLDRETLLENCLDSSSEEYRQGWVEYVESVVEAAERQTFAIAAEA